MGATGQILKLVLDKGPLSRADLSRVSGLSKPTVWSVSKELLEQQLITEIDAPTEGVLGRPASLFNINPNAWTIAGVDLGGTWVRVRCANVVGETIGGQVERVQGRRAELIAQISTLIATVLRDAGFGIGTLRKVVVASPGVVEPSSGELRLVPNLPQLEGAALGSLLVEELGCEVEIVNDVNAAAYAQHAELKGEIENSVFVAIGTGLGAGVVINGQIYRGATGEAGEVGYLPYQGGIIEDVVSGAGLEAAYRTRTNNVLAGREIFAAAATDEDARILTRYFGQGLAWLLAMLSITYNPDRIFIGGGVGLHLPLAVDDLTAAVRQLSPIVAPLQLTTLGDDAGLAGAVLRARDAATATVLETI